MAADSNHTPFLIDTGPDGQLCRELELAGIEPMLSIDREGSLTSGVTLSVNAATARESKIAAMQFREQAFDVLARGLPLSVSVSLPGRSAAADGSFSILCEHLRLAAQDAGAAPATIEIAIEADSLSPQAAWLMRCEHLGDGPVHVFPGHSKMRPGNTSLERNRCERFWLQLWRLRMNRMLRPALAPLVSSQCPLLCAEAAQGIIPSLAIQAPVGSAWVPMGLDVSRFADKKGSLSERSLEAALCCAVAIGDELHGRAVWPTAQMRHDAWLNRRLAIILSGFGELAQKRRLDPGRFGSLENLCDVLRWVQDTVHRQSRKIAQQTDCLPALRQGDPSCALPGGQIRNGWRKRWREAVSMAAIRHRNLLVLSPWSVFPVDRPADYRYSDLLPLLGFANACAFSEPPDLSRWNVNKFKSFHQRAWAVLQRRDAARQIAERL
jgi:hypothetical protein